MIANWIKLGNSLPDHPRVRDLDHPEAAWLYISGLCYADRMRTDGFIPKKMVPHLTSLPEPDKLMADLIRVGLWADAGQRVECLRYLDHNRSAAEIKAKEEQLSKAGKRAAAVRWGTDPDAEPMRIACDPDAIAMPEEKRIEESKTKDLKATSLPAEDDPPQSPAFDAFWTQYPAQKNGTKPEKKLARDQWQRLRPPERQRALDSVQHYKTHLLQTDQFSKHAFRYLRDRSFESYQSAPNEIANAPPKGHNARNFDAVVQRMERRNGTNGGPTNHAIPLRGLPTRPLE